VVIQVYLERIKDRLLTDPVVQNFHIVRQREALFDGFIRVRVTLQDDSFLEFSEYVQRTANDDIVIIKYSYHWANAQGDLIKRWDNAAHFPDLPGFPHHVHDGVVEQVLPARPVDIFVILDVIAQTIAA